MTRRLTLIDSSAFIETRRRPGCPVASAVRAAIADGRAAVCGVVAAELLTGCLSKSEYGEVELVLTGLAWLPLTDECWDRAAALGFNLRRSGVTVPLTEMPAAVAFTGRDMVGQLPVRRMPPVRAASETLMVP